ncbi:MAG: NADH-quinone oxidoreductase subunit L [Desulfuromonadales bacterium]|nr:NADH-quinone oxidoreductase subunit L [Desulfuromonadales bacterium]
MNQLTLIPVLPFIGFLINGLLGARLPKQLVALVACGLPAVSFLLSFNLFQGLASEGGSLDVVLFSWAALDNLKLDVALSFDQLSAVMCLVVTGVGTLIHIYSVGYMAEDKSFVRFFAYLNLFLFFMLLLVLGKNLLVLFAGWEGVGLASYLLIGFWFEDAEKTAAGIKAFVVNRIGDTAFLLAAFLLVYCCGTLDFQEINTSFSAGGLSPTMTNAIALLLLLGACGKSAQLPLHVWLPDAMAGPTPVSALIHAATMVTAGVYLLSRLSGVFLQAPEIMTVVAWGGAITALVGASMGLVQSNLKKVLAYSTMSQIGYMFMACGLGAFNVAMFHLTTHAFFKACLFLGAGSVIHALHGEEDMRKMGALAKKIPLTFITFMLASLALCGIPPFAGFFSKDEILWSAWSGIGGSPVLWAVATLTAGLTAFYMFRAIFMTFFGADNVPERLRKGIHEAPPTMAVILVVLALASVVAGFIGLPGLWRDWLGVSAPFYDFLVPVLGHGGGADHHMELILMLVSVTIAFTGVAMAWLLYLRCPEMPLRVRMKATAAYRLINDGYYFDAFYTKVVRCADWVSEKILARHVETTIDTLTTNLPADLAQRASKLFTRLQSGNVSAYVFYVFAGLALFLWWGVIHV